MITLTSHAKEELVKLISSNKDYLRVYVSPGGCSGLSYGMNIDNEPLSDDGDEVKYTDDGITVVVDEFTMGFVDGSVIDYEEDDLLKTGFTVFNPQALKSCACGSSFRTAEEAGEKQEC